ncbi:MAG: tetratricopeptide repeat protein [Candidatus Thiosymbion ectosymbiont of Robbea hypermnestra]|nr:tetratricopeptide repeat protein [Candidatus Thiosymbion ectosymbiont of Robbea hypermnestra]
MLTNQAMVAAVLAVALAVIFILVLRRKARLRKGLSGENKSPSGPGRVGGDVGLEDTMTRGGLHLATEGSESGGDPRRLVSPSTEAAQAYRIDLDGVSAGGALAVAIHHTPEQLRGLMTDQRREQRTLAAEFTELRDRLGVTDAALRAFLAILEREVPAAHWLARLSEIALRHQQALRHLAALETRDPQVRTLIDQARTAIEAGDYGEAEGLLDQAGQRELADILVGEGPHRKDPAKIAGQRRAAAALRAEQAEVLLIRLRYRKAAEGFAAAAELVPDTEPDARLTYLEQRAGALYRQGDEQGDNPALEAAIRAYRDLLRDHVRERVPLDWAMTQNNLGNALSILGEREAGTEHLEQALVAYRAALEEYTREQVPRRWATTQNNLGAALGTLGGRESDPGRLEAAAVAYRAALEEYTRERVPLDWARIQNNLGNVLWTLGEQASGTGRLEEAVAAYRAALEEYTRERAPLDWARTQNNLGNALRSLGKCEAGTEHLEEAVAAYRAALEEYSRERTPLDWARTQNNLGAALQTLGERESGTARLREAVAAYRAALRERTRERVPLDWARTWNNLGNALRTLGVREPGTERLGEAVAAYHIALRERTRERVPLQWASTQNNLGNTLGILGAREAGTERLGGARTCIENAWRVVKDAGMDQYDRDFRQRLEVIDRLVEARRTGK